jgi:hypothetical protein
MALVIPQDGHRRKRVVFRKNFPETRKGAL